MAFNLGGFAQGLTSGAEAGADLRQKAMQLKFYQMQLDQQKAALAAKAGLASSYLSGGDSGAQPGAAPGAGGPPAPAMPGATPMPQGMPQPAPTGPAGVAPMAKPPAPSAGPSSGMSGAPAPAPGSVPAGPGAPQAPNPMMSGTAQGMQDPVQSAKQTISSMYLRARQANPRASLAELTDIVEAQIGQIKGLTPAEDQALRAWQMLAATQVRGDTARDVAGIKERTVETVAETRAEASRYTADMTYKGRRYTADEALKGREYAADRGVEAAGIRAEGGVRAAEARGGGAGGLMGDLKMQQALERTEVGKVYARTATAVNEVNALAGQPDIEQNAEAQLGLINRYLYMTTGSTRPPLAEYKKILGARDGQDVYDMATGLIPYHPILGSDQISNLVRSANSIANNARDNALRDPLTSRVIHRIEGDLSAGHMEGQSGGGRGMTPPASGTPPVQALKEGHVTTFANGQQWTLQGGQPVRVK